MCFFWHRPVLHPRFPQVMDGFVRDQMGASYAIKYGAWPLHFVRSAALDSGSACAWGELPGGGCDANVISLG